MNMITKDEAIDVLSKAKLLAGSRWRHAVLTAWGSGDYRRQGLDVLAADLQRIRNTFGPSWLAGLKLGARHGRDVMAINRTNHHV